MNRRSIWVLCGVISISVPAWADCGSCGSGSKAGSANVQSHEHEQAHAEVGQAAPNFTLRDIAGTDHTLADLKGNVVVLEWTNHECPFVKRHRNAKKTLQKLMAKFQGKPVKWLIVDSSHFCAEKVESIQSWVKANEIAAPVLLDPEGTVGHLYEAKTTPHMFVVDSNGVLAYSGAIDNDPRGDQETARNYVAEAVEALLNGSTVTVATTKPYGCSVKYRKG